MAQPEPDPAPTGTVPARKRARRTLELAAALVLAPVLAGETLRRVSGESGLAEIRDTEVGVRFDAWSGTREVVDAPGFAPYVPWFQEVHTIDKSPNAFRFQGNRRVSVDHVPRLLVRARDGSTFWFDEVELQYALRVERADHVLEDSGAGDAFKEELLRCHARAILRDEFGRHAAGESARPDVVARATRASLDRLNAALAPHGIEVLEVSSPKPAFDKGYEDLINRRKLADQETEKLEGQLQNLALVAERRADDVRRDKERELEKLEGNLQKDEGAARKERIRAVAEADNVHAERVGQARVAKAELELQAAVMEERVRGLAEDARARAEALRRHGAGAVRAALIEGLAKVDIRIVPYSRDAAPARVEHENAPPGGR